MTAVADGASASDDGLAISGNVLTNDLSDGDDPLHVVDSRSDHQQRAAPR